MLISGQTLQIEADKSCIDSKTLQYYKIRIEQQSHGRKTLAETAPIHIMTLKIHKTLQDVRTNVRALHCDNLDHIRSCLNSVHVHYIEET